jgi:hypothetical protein
MEDISAWVIYFDATEFTLAAAIPGLRMRPSAPHDHRLVSGHGQMCEPGKDIKGINR